MKDKFIKLYMDWALRAAELSHARRLHVGAVIVKDDTVISYGYNGMPAGWDNNCEYKVTEFQTEYGVGSKLVNTGELKTRPEVLHSESNAIAKLAKSSNSGLGADLFVTHSPCLDCAKLIYQSGIRRVYFGENYRNDSGTKFLEKSGITVSKIEKNN
jgi:dCMP deaminase